MQGKVNHPIIIPNLMLFFPAFIQVKQSSHYLRRMMTDEDILLSVLKTTQFNKHLLSIYYVSRAVLSACSSEMNKTQILVSGGLWSNRRDHSHSVTLQEVKGLWKRKFSLVLELAKAVCILCQRKVSSGLIKAPLPTTDAELCLLHFRLDIYPQTKNLLKISFFRLYSSCKTFVLCPYFSQILGQIRFTAMEFLADCMWIMLCKVRDVMNARSFLV